MSAQKASLGVNRHNPKKEWRTDILNISKATCPSHLPLACKGPKVAQPLGGTSAPWTLSMLFFFAFSQPLSSMRFLFSNFHQGTRKGLCSLIFGAKAKSHQLASFSWETLRPSALFLKSLPLSLCEKAQLNTRDCYAIPGYSFPHNWATIHL